MKWKKINKTVVLILLPLFLFQGCGVKMIYANDPYKTEISEPKLVKTEKGQEIDILEQWEIVETTIVETTAEITVKIPPGEYPYPRFDENPVKPNNTFKAVEKMAKEKGWIILENKVEFPAIMTSGNNKKGKPYMIPTGKYILYEPKTQTNGDIILLPKEVASCGNQLVWAPSFKLVPRTITQVYKETWASTTIERYRDVEAAQIPWWIFPVGVGIVVLGLLFFGGGAAAAPVLCGPGAPVLIPVIP